MTAARSNLGGVRDHDHLIMRRDGGQTAPDRISSGPANAAINFIKNHRACAVAF